MPELTERELSCINEHLKYEQMCIRKYSLYARICSDPQIKTKCEQIAAKHQNHFTRLFNQLHG